MGNIPTEKKLELARMLRNESRQNRMKMRGRERIVYGEMPLYQKEQREDFSGGDACYKEAASRDKGESVSSLKLRLFAAILLFGAFVAWDNGCYPMLPANSGQLYRLIEEDSRSLNLFAFIEDFTYTLEGNE